MNNLIVYKNIPGIILQETNPSEYLCYWNNMKIVLTENRNGKIQPTYVASPDNKSIFYYKIKTQNPKDGLVQCIFVHQSLKSFSIEWTLPSNIKKQNYKLIYDEKSKPKEHYKSLAGLAKETNCPDFLKTKTIWGYKQDLTPIILMELDPNIKYIHKQSL